ncbi:AAA family ATPase [Campylobacter sputorum]|uniref:cytidylate kinase-like family protein n=1 Tax=Campylobacter sputorum TaxID=206 RepID=UPI00069165B1|nr:cytidylate kinase-like family protein [Campylobacter sputorum]
MIISIGRQTGSGGREIAYKLSNELNFTYLNKEKLLQKAKDFGYFEEMNRLYKEKPVNSLLQAIVKNEVALEKKDNIRKIYNELIKDGDYIIVGRCANYFLRQNSDFLSVFLHASAEFKTKRIMEQENLNKQNALEYMELEDTNRESFHNYYTNEKWGDSIYYDLCIDTSKFGIEKTIKFIINAIKNL